MSIILQNNQTHLCERLTRDQEITFRLWLKTSLRDHGRGDSRWIDPLLGVDLIFRATPESYSRLKRIIKD